MSTSKSYTRKSIHSGTGIFIWLFLCILSLGIAVNRISQQPEGNEPNNRVYEDNLEINESDKYNSVEYKWNFVTSRMKKKNINLKLKFLEKEINSSYRLLLDIENMTKSELGITAVNYDENYKIQYWTGVYNKLYSHDYGVFQRVGELFKEIASEENLSHIDTVNLVTSMVQNIQYEVPKLTSFEVLSPTLCINYRYGDCDTKTLLLLVVLRSIGVDCVHLHSNEYSHAMIGINIPSTGEYIEHGGMKYYFLETTSAGWYLGVLPPDVNNKTYWDVLEY